MMSVKRCIQPLREFFGWIVMMSSFVWTCRARIACNSSDCGLHTTKTRKVRQFDRYLLLSSKHTGRRVVRTDYSICDFRRAANLSPAVPIAAVGARCRWFQQSSFSSMPRAPVALLTASPSSQRQRTGHVRCWCDNFSLLWSLLSSPARRHMRNAQLR